MSEIDNLKEENRYLRQENEALRVEIEGLTQRVKDYSVVNGFMRRSNERKSRMRRRF